MHHNLSTQTKMSVVAA